MAMENPGTEVPKMATVVSADDFFWELIEKDVKAFVNHGGPNREAQHRRMANLYGVDLWRVCGVWSDARRDRRQREHGDVA
jgi:hypothetical protein